MSDIYPIAVPKWGIEMVEGTVNAWTKKEGETVAKGDEVFEMESDKITNVWEAPADGVLRRILAQEGDTRAVGALLGIIAAADVDDTVIDAFVVSFADDTPVQDTAAAAAPAVRSGGAGSAATRSSPSVRRLAQELEVDLEVVNGTGRRGRITEDDVREAASGGADASNDDVDIIALSPTRKTIARRLTAAKQEIPHFYLTVEWELDGLLAHRKELNASGDTQVSVNDLIVWCTSRALMKEPRVNVNLIGDDIHQFKNANVSVAIATGDGLYPATVRKAEAMSPGEIASAIGALADKAGSGKLTAEDISGGSFTVSNLGMYGVSNFIAIVNPPMGAILAVGKGKQKVVVKDGAPAVATMINATLSCDHRAIDGSVGAHFLQVLGEEIAAFG